MKIKTSLLVPVLLTFLLTGICTIMVMMSASSEVTSYDPSIPNFGGTLHIWLSNNRREVVKAAVSMDNKSIMIADLPGKGIIPIIPAPELGAISTFDPSNGNHELKVVVNGYGEVGRAQFTKSAGVTNYVSIYINKNDPKTGRPGCLIGVKTNIQGGI